MATRTYLLSWVAVRNDPWPFFEPLARLPGGGGPHPRDRDLQVAFGTDEDPQWPGVPRVTARGGKPVVYLGPTLTAFFHPKSPYHCFRAGQEAAPFDAVHLLYRPEDEVNGRRVDDPLTKAALEPVMRRLAQARGCLDVFEQRVHFTPIPDIRDPTQHEQVLDALEEWLRKDPLQRKRNRDNLEVHINLSPGTPTMHACWLMLYWRHQFGSPANTDVTFFQGDGGFEAGIADDDRRTPITFPPIAQRCRFLPDALPPAPREERQPASNRVELDDLRSPPYQALAEKIEQSARLSLPIILTAPRGAGKTFLAQHYHERRQAFRGAPREQHGVSKWTPKPRADRPPLTLPVNAPASPRLVPVTLSEYADLQELRDTLFGWAPGSFTGAGDAFNDGLLGQAHGGTLFLDEIHHLGKDLQALLLGVLNERRYRPKMAGYEVLTDFDLVVATNDPGWRGKLADDFRDRIERVVLEVPSFRDLQRYATTDLRTFWEFTLKRRCEQCGVAFHAPDAECEALLGNVLEYQPMPGNWRDLMRLADQVLLHLVGSEPQPPFSLNWDIDHLRTAVKCAFLATTT